MKWLTSSVALLCVVLLCGCEKESWDLVSPPPGADSIMVRLVNLSPQAPPCVLELDAGSTSVRTAQVAPYAASAPIASPADSAYVRLRAADGSVLKMLTPRVRFVRRTYETFVLLPSPQGSPQQRVVDTLVRLVTNAATLPLPGRAQLRFLCAVPDTALPFEVRLGCPSGEFFDRQLFRGSGAFRDVPAGELVVSILRGSDPVAIVRGTLPEQRFATLIVAGSAGSYRVFLLDELAPTASTLVELVPIPVAERTAQIRWMNVSRYTFDSLRLRSGQVIATGGQGMSLSSYRTIAACSGTASDTLELYSNGILQSAVPVSIEVGYRYTVVVSDAPNFGAPASQLIVIARDRHTLTNDSAQWTVVNALGRGEQLTALLGARLDSRGAYHNGELLAAALDDGEAAAAVRVPAGVMPIMLRSGSPERVVALAVDTAQPGRDYILVAVTAGDGAAQLYAVSDVDPAGALIPLPAGVYVRIANAVADRGVLDCQLGTFAQRSGLTVGNSVGTVLPIGVQQVRANSAAMQLQLLPDHRVTIVAVGNASAPQLIVLDSLSLQPTTFVARVRCVNAAPDVPLLRVARDQLSSADQWNSNIFADNLAFGFASAPYELPRLQRINLLFGSPQGQLLLRPDGSVSFALGKAYTLVFYGTASAGYNFFILQEL